MHTHPFTHIGIVGKYGASHVGDTIARVVAVLDARHIQVTLDQNTMPAPWRDHERARPIAQWPDDINLAIVIGGDGTFLYAGRSLLEKNIPLLGINTGRLGFLADLPLETLEDSLSAILDGHYRREYRHTLSVRVTHQGRDTAQFFAINDAVIHKRSMARMIEVEVFTRGHYLSHYRADGLILATPTGSTAYALSAGGPIIEPTLDAMLVVPICPHTLTQRPVVIDGQSDIEVCVSASSIKDVQLTIDGQAEHLLNPTDRITIRRAEKLTVIHPADYQFQSRLRQKLNWGIAPEGPH
ncbi:MAG: NAD(+)/NADH kinase [Cardiobacteriaceae bacterium]|nr:NAD(+)/NADH kinase [Cardiobacteriaceae bacterium]